MCVGIATADTDYTLYSGANAGAAGYAFSAANLTFQAVGFSGYYGTTYNTTLNIFDSTMTNVGSASITMPFDNRMPTDNPLFVDLHTDQNVLSIFGDYSTGIKIVFDGTNLINSFYIDNFRTAHSNSYLVTANYALQGGGSASFSDIYDKSNEFWGVTFADGASLTSIELTVSGHPGGYIGNIGIYGSGSGSGGDPSDVPEPGSILLLGTGLLGLGLAAKRKLTSK